jgi:hypothetical protein
MPWQVNIRMMGVHLLKRYVTFMLYYLRELYRTEVKNTIPFSPEAPEPATLPVRSSEV